MPSPDFCRKVKKTVAANFDESLALYQAFEERHHFFADLSAELAGWIDLRPGASVLDVGCGSGISARVLSETFGCRVLGVDLSCAMVEAGRRMLAGRQGVRLVVGDGEDLAAVAGDARFDAVLYNAAIFIFPDVDRAVQSAAACLVPGGRIAFSFYPDLVGPDGEDLLDEAFRRSADPPPRFRVITGYEAACRAIQNHCGPVSHHRWQRPLDLAFLKDFFSIPAQSASLFPGLPYDRRRERVCRLLDGLSDLAGQDGAVVWRMAQARMPSA